MKFSQRVYTKLKHFVSLLVFIGAAALCCAAYAYDYPFDNPYMATVVGTPSEFRAPLPEIAED
jgi:hypothetical protein